MGEQYEELYINQSTDQIEKENNIVQLNSFLGGYEHIHTLCMNSFYSL